MNVFFKYLIFFIIGIILSLFLKKKETLVEGYTCITDTTAVNNFHTSGAFAGNILKMGCSAKNESDCKSSSYSAVCSWDPHEWSFRSAECKTKPISTAYCSGQQSQTDCHRINFCKLRATDMETCSPSTGICTCDDGAYPNNRTCNACEAVENTNEGSPYECTSPHDTRIASDSCNDGYVRVEGCGDLDSRCALWATAGECESNPSYMSENCRVSCHIDGCQAAADRCERCPDGNRVDPQSNACIQCEIGSAGIGGNCSPCVTGTVQGSMGQDECESCTDGKIQNIDASACVCPDGQSEDPQSNTCELCEIGTAGIGGNCSPCVTGTFQGSTGQSSCHTPSGEYIAPYERWPNEADTEIGANDYVCDLGYHKFYGVNREAGLVVTTWQCGRCRSGQIWQTDSSFYGGNCQPCGDNTIPNAARDMCIDCNGESIPNFPTGPGLGYSTHDNQTCVTNKCTIPGDQQGYVVNDPELLNSDPSIFNPNVTCAIGYIGTPITEICPRGGTDLTLSGCCSLPATTPGYVPDTQNSGVTCATGYIGTPIGDCSSEPKLSGCYPEDTFNERSKCFDFIDDPINLTQKCNESDKIVLENKVCDTPEKCISTDYCCSSKPSDELLDINNQIFFSDLEAISGETPEEITRINQKITALQAFSNNELLDGDYLTCDIARCNNFDIKSDILHSIKVKYNNLTKFNNNWIGGGGGQEEMSYDVWNRLSNFINKISPTSQTLEDIINTDENDTNLKKYIKLFLINLDKPIEDVQSCDIISFGEYSDIIAGICSVGISTQQECNGRASCIWGTAPGSTHSDCHSYRTNYVHPGQRGGIYAARLRAERHGLTLLDKSLCQAQTPDTCMTSNKQDPQQIQGCKLINNYKYPTGTCSEPSIIDEASCIGDNTWTPGLSPLDLFLYNDDEGINATQLEALL